MEEFIKVTAELKEFRKDINKIDSRLTVIETKLNVIKQNNLQLHKDLTDVKRGVDKGEHCTQELQDSRALEEDFDCPDVDVEELQSVVENSNNLAQ